MMNYKTENILFSAELSPALITQIIIDRFKNSPFEHDMMLADQYYNGHNEKIDHKTRKYFDKDRKEYDNPNASNARIKSNFLRMLVQQKQDYGFAKTFIVKISNESEKEIDLTVDNYGKEFKKFCNDKLYKLAYALAGQAINYGVSWCYVWIDENGELQINDVPANLIYPVWCDRQHTKLNKLVYNYIVEKYNGSINPTFNEYAEYWSDNERILFDVNEGYGEIPIVQDDSGKIIHSHMIDGNNNGVNWDKIPFIAFKATDDERTLLSFIKEQIDCYDVLSSKSIDGLIDDLDPLLILKGISPDINSLIEARELAKMTRTISLDADGDANYIQSQTAIDAHLQELQELRRDIIKFGYGIDYEDARFSGNPNQLVIKSLYQNMDTYTDGIERHFQDFIDELKYFFDKWFELTGKGSFEECQKYKILIKLDRSMMINQSALIDDTVKLQGIGISRRTQLEFNPIVQDVELELERLEEEKESESNMFDFPMNMQAESDTTDEIESDTDDNESEVKENDNKD